MLRLLMGLSLVVFCIATKTTTASPVLAFPEADGYGKYTVGGRGGKVFVVTSLDDNPSNPQPGTLRHAIEQHGPRIITFAVSGVIDLQDKLVVRNDFITIAGQTSPYGIVLRSNPFVVQASQVVVRYMRFRLGTTIKNVDAASGKNESDIIFDHCSFSWSIDEVASFYNNVNFTLQYSIIAQALNQATHTKGEHGYGGIWGGAGASFHHNVLAHNVSRNPRIAGHRLNAPYAKEFEITDIVNNIVYNWGSNSAYGGEDGHFNFIANLYIAGPATQAQRIFRFYRNTHLEQYGRGYFAHNQLVDTEGKQLPPKVEIKALKKQATPSVSSLLLPQAASAKLAPLFATHTAIDHIHTPEDLYEKLISNKEVGANRTAAQPNGEAHDRVDQGILSDIQHKTANHGNRGIINSELEVIPSWKAYAKDFIAPPQQATQSQDANLNGIADSWEATYNISSANEYELHDDYTNIEVYINALGAF